MRQLYVFPFKGTAMVGLWIIACCNLPLIVYANKGISSFRPFFSVQKNVDVHGVVTDESDEPLPGVSVAIQGTDRGTTTDTKGEFVLQNVSDHAILVFSYIGYNTKKIPVNGRTAVNVRLQPAQTKLDQLVVVGYGKEKKKDLTGAVSTISSDQIGRRNTVSASDALQGLAPGVTVTQQTGAPGGDQAQIHIRGLSSLGGSSMAPLVIIDGVPGDINDVDPNMIQSVSVLKDAASAAIYGSRAANGVILITTKRAEKKLAVTYKGFIGKQSPTDIPKVTNGLTYMRVFNDASMNDNGIKIYSDQDIQDFKKKYEADPGNYDWQSAILQGSGLVQSHYISVSTSNGIISASPSLSYTDQQGIIKNTNFKRYAFRNNMDIKPGKKLDIQVDVAVTNKNRLQVANPASVVWNYFGRMPTNIPIKYGDLWSTGWVKINPVADIMEGGDIKTNNLEFWGNLGIKYDPTDWLSLSGRFAPRYVTRNVHNFSRSVMTYNEDGSEAGAAFPYTDLTESGDRYFYGTYQFTGTLHKGFNGHNFNLMVGTSRETYDEKVLSGYRRNFVFNDFEQLTAGAEDGTQTNNGEEYQWLLISGFSRLTYNFREKYLFEANLRYDGSSRFIGDNQWSAFPSFSGGWIISKEPFFDKIRSSLNFLKIRASWGELGNQDIGSSYYPFSEPLSLGSASFGGNIIPVIAQTTLSNPDLKWEQTNMTDIGLDADLFDHLSLTFDWYDKKTKGILMKLNTPELIGMASPYQNAGIVRNMGWGITASYHKKWGNFYFGVALNLSDIKNKILDMKGQTQGTLLRQQKGYPINSIYGYVSDKLYQSQQEIDNGPVQFGTLHPGDIRYVDFAGAADSAGKSGPDGKITDADKKIIGSTIPRYTYGINIDLKWKNISLDAFVQGVGKVDGYLDGQYVIPTINSSSIKPWQLDYWTPDNKNAKLPRVSTTSTNNIQNSTFWMRSAAYLRLKTIQLGYNIPKDFLKKFGINSLEIYLSGQNVLTLTNFYPGYDPEINYNAGAGTGVSLGSGNYYPQVKQFDFGINLNF